MGAKKHGHTIPGNVSPTYNTWTNMVGRCTKPYHAKYSRYGAKGITVCDEWLVFSNFLADMGERPDGMTIDRIDGSLGYFKENCRWATLSTQQRNMKSNVLLTYNGRTQCVSDWAKEIGIDKTLLAWRIRNGWDTEQALTINPKVGNNTKKTNQVLMTYLGETKCCLHWAKEYGISNSLLRLRLSKGWSLEKALTTPKGNWNRKAVQADNP